MKAENHNCLLLVSFVMKPIHKADMCDLNDFSTVVRGCMDTILNFGHVCTRRPRGGIWFPGHAKLQRI